MENHMSTPVKYPRIPDVFNETTNVRLCWYRKHGEVLVGEEKLSSITLHDLQDIFDVYIDNRALNYWHVKTRQARILQRLTEHKIKMQHFIYFVEQKAFA